MEKYIGEASEVREKLPPAISLKIAYEQADGPNYEVGQPIELKEGDKLVKGTEKIRLMENIYSGEAPDSSGWRYVVIARKTHSDKWKDIVSPKSAKNIIHDFTGWALLVD